MNNVNAITSSLNIVSLIASAFCGVACGWILHGYTLNKTNSIKEEEENDESSDEDESNEEGDINESDTYKMVIVVRQDLKMGKGKIAAQCSHAAVGAFKQQSKNKKTVLKSWEYCGQPKVVVKCQDETELLALFHHAKAVGVTATVIQDAGRTQIAAGSRTVLGVGPGPENLVNKVTSHLKLL